MAPFDDAVFGSSADYYARTRPHYPVSVLDEIAAICDHRRVLDVAAGTGRLAIPLARLVQCVLAAEPDPQMLAAGKAECRMQRVRNVRWIRSVAEALPVARGTFSCVTIGSAFHWLDVAPALAEFRRVLQDGGTLVLVHDARRPVAIRDALTEGPPSTVPWDEIVEVIESYLGPRRRAGHGFYEPPAKSLEESLDLGGWSIDQAYCTTGEPIKRSVDDVIAVLLSKSFCSPALFGSRLNSFVADVRELLQGRGEEFLSVPRFEIVVARPN